DPDVWKDLPPKRRAALLSQSYNLGKKVLKKHKKWSTKLNKRDWKGYEREMFDIDEGFTKECVPLSLDSTHDTSGCVLQIF
ncbi:unnamed protein product, partial [marine sediment metagenome]